MDKDKIIQLQLPDTMTKLLSNFLVNRKARTKINTYTGPEFQIQAGVPQGNPLSQSLHDMYSRHLSQDQEQLTFNMETML